MGLSFYFSAFNWAHSFLNISTWIIYISRALSSFYLACLFLFPCFLLCPYVLQIFWLEIFRIIHPLACFIIGKDYNFGYSYEIIYESTQCMWINADFVYASVIVVCNIWCWYQYIELDINIGAKYRISGTVIIGFLVITKFYDMFCKTDKWERQNN
jgi:hypothetical protein